MRLPRHRPMLIKTASPPLIEHHRCRSRAVFAIARGKPEITVSMPGDRFSQKHHLEIVFQVF
jgi:hypothetical protein